MSTSFTDVSTLHLIRLFASILAAPTFRYVRLAGALLLSVALVACGQPANTPETSEPAVVVSPNDDRAYDLIELANAQGQQRVERLHWAPTNRGRVLAAATSSGITVLRKAVLQRRVSQGLQLVQIAANHLHVSSAVDETAAGFIKTDLQIVGVDASQDKVLLSRLAPAFKKELTETFKVAKAEADRRVPVKGENFDLGHGDVVIAAITSCTNTSNPSVMLGAGLLAKNALKKGLKVKPWVKTSLAPGSQVVTDYLAKAKLQEPLNALGFDLVGYGCTTCIGNSGPLPDPIAETITAEDLTVGAVISGNRNFEGRVHPQVKANYLASPILVVAYALAGSLKVDLRKDPLGEDDKGKPVYLKDIWPTNADIAKAVEKAVTGKMFKDRYADVFKGDARWQKIKTGKGLTYGWDKKSTYVQNPPYFEGMKKTPGKISDVKGARILALLGDSITTDHISPAGSIKKDSPAGEYLMKNKVAFKDFNSYGSRRGNHEVMMRGTFANIRLRNELAPGTEGGVTRHMPDGKEMSIYDAAMQYQKEKTPLVIFAGIILPLVAAARAHRVMAGAA